MTAVMERTVVDISGFLSATIEGYKLKLDCFCEFDLNVQPLADDFRVFHAEEELNVQSAYIEQSVFQMNSQIVIAIDRLLERRIALRVSYLPEEVPLLIKDCDETIGPFDRSFYLIGGTTGALTNKELINKVIHDHVDGMSQREIGLSLGVDVSTVRRLIGIYA